MQRDILLIVIGIALLGSELAYLLSLPEDRASTPIVLAKGASRSLNIERSGTSRRSMRIEQPLQ